MPEKEVTLPLELWRLVLSYLSVADLCRCSQVCKEWRELVKSLDSTRWKTLFLAAKKWRHPNWPNTTEKEPSSWKSTYKAHHIASQQWINRSIDVRCSPFFIALRRRPEKVTLHVGPGKKYSSIRDALSAASPFDRIVLHPGIYDEQHFLVLKFPIEIYGEGEIGDVVIQMTIEQQCSTARLVNVVVQPGTGMLVQNSPVIMKVGQFSFTIYRIKLLILSSSFPNPLIER